MKVKDIFSFTLPAMTKPRNPNQEILAAKKNAAGQHRNKKRDISMGQDKHKDREYKEDLS